MNQETSVAVALNRPVTPVLRADDLNGLDPQFHPPILDLGLLNIING
jgi:hypothetical protein